ncbi:MAG TPA: alpha/beta hydrolase-fold protein [Gemmatimonadaceae bacterium]|nr:alpha/beta hydrolase-fold protein [Gemmatimonadaceae bacterium]
MPLITRVARVAVLVSVPVSTAVAQDSSRTPWVQEVVTSSTLGKRVVYVATPDAYARGIERYGVLVLLDADDSPQFRLGIAQAAYLADNEPGIPPLIVVGIVNGADRLHDMLPPATGSSVTEFKTAGGAAAFADYIVGQVLPMVRAKYRTLPTTILAGHSAGGLFALDVAATRPGAFQAIIAMSPSLWYNDSSLVVTYADAIAKSTTRPRLFATSGGLESDIDITTRRFAQRLDSLMPASHTFAHQRYPNDTHALTPLSSLPDGLRFVFEPVSSRNLPISTVDPNADSATVFSALSASEASYAKGARSLSLPEVLPEPVINRLGYRVLGRSKNPALAIALFKLNVKRYPKSVNVYDSLGDGYLAAGDTTAAIAQLRKAVAVGRETGAPVAAETSDKLAKLSRRN